MIYIDNRVGSKELYPLFPPHSAELTHMEYADLMFTGHHVDGDVVVGVERKRIGDLINSMCSGRLGGHQIIGMLNSYHVCYIIVEGIFRANPQDGLLEVWRRGGWQAYTMGKRRFMARDVWCFLNTLEIVCGVHCYHCSRETDTVYWVMALAHWWAKEYGDHKSHLQPNTSGNGKVQLFKQSVVRRVAGQLDGIGWEKAKSIGEVYDTVGELVMANEGELVKIGGIGKKLAKGIVEQLMGKI